MRRPRSGQCAMAVPRRASGSGPRAAVRLPRRWGQAQVPLRPDLNRRLAVDPLYLTLRNLTTPIVAITTSANGKRNGLIVNSAQRASLVPAFMRVSMYISKTNLTHELIWASGVFGLHLLRADQWNVVRELGIDSGRERDKL